MDIEWKNLTDGSFKGTTFHVAIPSTTKGHGISSDEITVERKLQVIDRPLMDGSQVGDFGRKGRVFSAEIVFFGPTYTEDLEKFETVLNEGTSGVLTLPDEPRSYKASFQRMVKRADSSGSNTKMVSVTWLEDEQQIAVFAGETSLSGADDLLSLASKAKDSVSSGQSILNDNIFLTAIRGLESGLSLARSSVNAVLTLTDGVRSRIVALDAELKGTLALINSAIDEISTLLGNKSTQQPNTSSQVFASSIDETTGQRVADFNEPDTITPTADPLAIPSVQPTTNVTLPSIQSESSAIVAINRIVESISATRDEMTSTTDGRTYDVHRAMSSVIANLKAMSEAIQPPPAKLVLVPMEMSLAEIVFFNGGSVDDIDEVFKKNTFLNDPLVVTKDTVVTL